MYTGVVSGLDCNKAELTSANHTIALGFAAAKRIAQAGANLIMAIRSGIPEKGEQIKQASGNLNVQAYHVDLLDFESINKLLEDLEKGTINYEEAMKMIKESEA